MNKKKKGTIEKEQENPFGFVVGGSVVLKFTFHTACIE